MTRILVLSLALLSFAANASAQKDLARERVSLQFKDTPIAQVFPALAKSLGYELTLDPQMRALVTLQIENVTAQTALNTICESVGCRWRQVDKRLIVEPLSGVQMIWGPNDKGEQMRRAGGDPTTATVRDLDDVLPVDITWSPVDVGTAFYFLGRYANATAEVAPPLNHRKIAVSIKKASVRQAFDQVCAIASCRWELIEQPKRIVRVTDRESQAEPHVFERSDPGVVVPRAIVQPKPSYTSEAMQAKKQGVVVLSCVVQPDGTVSDVHVVKALDPALDQEAVNTLYRWRFAPGTLQGRPVPVRVQVEMTFTMR